MPRMLCWGSPLHCPFNSRQNAMAVSGAVPHSVQNAFYWRAAQWNQSNCSSVALHCTTASPLELCCIQLFNRFMARVFRPVRRVWTGSHDHKIEFELSPFHLRDGGAKRSWEMKRPFGHTKFWTCPHSTSLHLSVAQLQRRSSDSRPSVGSWSNSRPRHPRHAGERARSGQLWQSSRLRKHDASVFCPEHSGLLVSMRHPWYLNSTIPKL